jgi:Hemolysin coregulated protein Hcp (TssD)
MKNKQLFSHSILFIVFILNSLSIFSQTTKKENDTTECTIILEAEGKKYCISNLSYSTATSPKYSEDGKKIIENSYDTTYYCSASIPTSNFNQDLADWAFSNPHKKIKCTIKVYNPGKIRVIKEVTLEDAYLSGFSDVEDSSQNNSYLTSSLSFTCKKLSVKVNK